MIVTKPISIRVEYEERDGYHIFTSPDVYGLYVMHQDPKIAFEWVAPSIEELLFLNDSVRGRVLPALTYHEYLVSREADKPSLITHSRQYLLTLSEAA